MRTEFLSPKKSHLRHTRKRRRVSGQIEIMSTTVSRAVIAIGIISVLAVAYYLYNDSEASAMIDEIEAINSAIEEIYLPSGSYQGLDSWSLAQSNVLPNTWTGAAFGYQQIFTPWHNIININLYSVNTLDDSYALDLYNTPPSVCTALVTTRFKAEQSIQVWSTQWNYNRINSDDPINPSLVADSCGQDHAMIEMYFSNTTLTH